MSYYQNQGDGQSKNCGISKNVEEFRKAASALVDAATLGLGCDANIRLHPALREFLIDEIADSPDRAADLFKENFIEMFLEQIIAKGDRSRQKSFVRNTPIEPQ